MEGVAVILGGDPDEVVPEETIGFPTSAEALNAFVVFDCKVHVIPPEICDINVSFWKIVISPENIKKVFLVIQGIPIFLPAKSRLDGD